MKLKYKMLSAFLGLGLIPALVVSLLSIKIASDSLTEQAYNQLTSIRAIKQSQIESYFAERKGDLDMLAENVKRLMPIQSEADLDPYAHELHDYFQHFINAYSYYDLFIINKSGDIVYTVARESDYQTNLVNGPFKNSGLGKLFTKVSGSKSYQIEDFASYAPSNGDPAAFIAEPVIINGVELVLALQLSNEKIDAVMQQRDGMGQTGETYLVGQDLRMRSNSFLDPVGHSVKASFKGTISKNGVDTEAVSKALKGITDTKIITDYNGNPVLSAFTSLQIGDFSWVLLAEIDEAEAMSPVIELKKWMAVIMALTIASVLIITFIIVRSIIRPLGGEPNEMKKLTERIAAGDLTVKFDEDKQAGGVYGSMRKMSNNLSDVMGKIVDASGQLSSTAAQTSATSEQANVSLQQQQTNVETVSSAMLEMSATIQDVAANAREVADSTTLASELSKEASVKVEETIEVIRGLEAEVNHATDVIDKMDSKSQEIGSVLEVIRGIADQTNLLALNAAIEAARAGEQGRGFAVVADEVRQLAQKTQQSTSHIEEMIAVLQQGTQDAVNVMRSGSNNANSTVISAEETSKVIDNNFEQIKQISERAEQIAAAAIQQSHAAEEISQSLVNINDAAAQNAVGAEQTAAASIQLNGLALELNDITDHFQLDRNQA